MVGTALGAAVSRRGQQGLATAPAHGQPCISTLPTQRVWAGAWHRDWVLCLAASAGRRQRKRMT